MFILHENVEISVENYVETNIVDFFFNNSAVYFEFNYPRYLHI